MEFQFPTLSDGIAFLGELLGMSAEALGLSPSSIAEGFTSWIISSIAAAFESLLSPVFNIIMDPIQFDFTNELMLGFQGAALVVVFCIIVARGITKGIIGAATDDDMDLVKYIWRSLVPIGAIIVAPTLTATVTSVSANLVSIVAGNNLSETFCMNLAAMAIQQSSGTMSVTAATAGILNAPMLLASAIAYTAIFWNLFTLAIEILKRWIQLAMVSIIMPLTAITSAIDDPSDLISAIKTSVGIGITIVLQVLMLVASSTVAASYTSYGIVEGSFLILALLAAAKSLPSWIDKFTYASSVSTSNGGGVRAAALATRLVSRNGSGHAAAIAKGGR